MRIPEDDIQDWIIKNTSFDGWTEFCQRFGGQRWYIPTTPAKIARDAEIRRSFNDIMSIHGVKKDIVLMRVSRRYNISVSTVKRIV